jgi:hypothetical protein
LNGTQTTKKPPKGWESFVERLRRESGIADAGSLATTLHEKGYPAGGDVGAILRRAKHEGYLNCARECKKEACPACECKEANAAATNGQLMRKGVKKEHEPGGQSHDQDQHGNWASGATSAEPGPGGKSFMSGPPPKVPEGRVAELYPQLGSMSALMKDSGTLLPTGSEWGWYRPNDRMTKRADYIKWKFEISAGGKPGTLVISQALGEAPMRGYWADKAQKRFVGLPEWEINHPDTGHTYGHGVWADGKFAKYMRWLKRLEKQMKEHEPGGTDHDQKKHGKRDDKGGGKAVSRGTGLAGELDPATHAKGPTKYKAPEQAESIAAALEEFDFKHDDWSWIHYPSSAGKRGERGLRNYFNYTEPGFNGPVTKATVTTEQLFEDNTFSWVLSGPTGKSLAKGRNGGQLHKALKKVSQGSWDIRPGKKPSWKTGFKKTESAALSRFTALREVRGTSNNERGADVVLITEGQGNEVDRNYYPKELIRNSTKTFEGVRCFLDHPSRREEIDRPERSVREQCGWFSQVRPGNVDGRAAILARLNFMRGPAGREAHDLVVDALRYQQEYPDKVLAGLSINGEGPSHEADISGEQWNVVDAIDKAISVDLVTFPARGGQILGMREAEQSASWRAKFRRALERAK